MPNGQNCCSLGHIIYTLQLHSVSSASRGRVESAGTYVANTTLMLIVNKAKSTLGLMKNFLNNRDIDIRTKHIYISFTMNAALWGCESWNLSAKNKEYLESFHHSTNRRIINIKWQQIREGRIRKKQVRFCFCNILKMESFINKRMATYIRKIARSNDEEPPKKFLGAWMNQPRKTGGQQLSCSN